MCSVPGTSPVACDSVKENKSAISHKNSKDIFLISLNISRRIYKNVTNTVLALVSTEECPPVNFFEISSMYRIRQFYIGIGTYNVYRKIHFSYSIFSNFFHVDNLNM